MIKKLSLDEMNNLATKMAKIVEPNTTIALIGDLGTGKTTFVKKFAEELGVKENLKSPTFNYVLEYLSGKIPLYHFDVYRLCDAQEIHEIGYEDYINAGGVSIIEWADIIESELPKKYIKITLKYSDDENYRLVNLEYFGDKKMEEVLLKNVNFSN